MASPTELPTIESINLSLPPSTLNPKALAYTKQHCTEAVTNHTIRSAYWAILISKKLPEFTTKPPNLETVVLSCLLHDLGWAKTPHLLSADKRFEVDSANLAREFIQASSPETNESTTQRVWDAIALHTSGSIARHAAPEVALTYLGVIADFMGPTIRGPGDEVLIISEEYEAVMRAFPRAGFNVDGFKGIMCWLCRTKAETTFDNWVGAFGREFGTDGLGGEREVYARTWEERQATQFLIPGLEALEALDPKV
jgi:hypothetical protein